MRVLPNMTIFSPASPIEAREATLAAAKLEGPVYLRLGTTKEKEIFASDYEFEVGRGLTVQDGKDITVVATGSILADALKAVHQLNEQGISARLINIHTIKPLDREILIRAARETGAILTVEEHNVMGGLGSAVAEVLMESQHSLTGFLRMGLQDQFCKGYGSHTQMKEINGLSAKHIFKQALSLYQSK
jgi:transketolase